MLKGNIFDLEFFVEKSIYQNKDSMDHLQISYKISHQRILLLKMCSAM